MSRRITRDPLVWWAAVGCWTAWAVDVALVAVTAAPSIRFWTELGDPQMAAYEWNLVWLILAVPTAVALCAIGMLWGSAGWAGAAGGLLTLLVVPVLGFSALLSIGGDPAWYGLGWGCTKLVLLLVVGSASVRLRRSADAP